MKRTLWIVLSDDQEPVSLLPNAWATMLAELNPSPPFFRRTPSHFASFLHRLDLLTTLCFACLAGASDGPAPGPREITPFDTDWRFHIGDDPAAKQPGFDDGSWRALEKESKTSFD
jgi:hypothetical protein